MSLLAPRGVDGHSCGHGLLLAALLGALAAGRVNAELTAVDRTCTNTVTSQMSKLAISTGKSLYKCLQGNRLAGQSIEACVAADNGGKIALFEERLRTKVAAACATSSVHTGTANFIPGVAVDGARSLLHALFGPDLDQVVETGSAGPAVATRKCQLAVVKQAHKCQKAKLTEYGTCKAGALAGKNGAPLAHLPELRRQCLMTAGDPASGQPDPGRKIARACGERLERIVTSRCAGVDLGRAFPSCSKSSPAGAARCADVSVECEVCKSLDASDGLIRDCDLFDNGRADESCIDPKTPRFDGIVFSAANDVDRATLAWAPATDDATPPEGIRYEVHGSTSPDFEPTADTLLKTVTSALRDDVTGLQADTTYRFTVVAVDAEGRRSTTLVHATEVTPDGPVLFSDTTPFQDAAALGLGLPTVAGTSFTYRPAAAYTLPIVGAVLVGPVMVGPDADGGYRQVGYLRRVVSATSAGGTVVVETTDTSLADAIEEISLSATHQLIEPEQIPNAAAGLVRTFSATRANGDRVTTMQWPDGSLRIDRVDQGDGQNVARLAAAADGRYAIMQGPFSLEIDVGFKPQFETRIRTKKGWLGLPTGIKSAEVIAKGTLTAEAAVGFGLSARASVEVPVGPTLTYTSVYAVGPVPIYQEIQYRLSARISAVPKGACRAGGAACESDGDCGAAGPCLTTGVGARVEANASAHAEMGLVYDGIAPHDDDGWRTHQVGPTFEHGFTSRIDAAGRVAVELRLIPRIDLRFYHVAGGYLSFEPFVDMGLGVANADHPSCGYPLFDPRDPLASAFPNGVELTNLDAHLGAECWAGVYIDIIIKRFSYDRMIFDVGPYTMFSLPTLALEQTSANPPQLLASVTDGVNDAFDTTSARWRTSDPVTIGAPAGPPYGATVQCAGATSRNVTVAFTGSGILGDVERQCVARTVVCPVCRDGLVDGDEECDTGGESATCDDDCTHVECGDGHRNPTAGEQCDDGNARNGDACTARCRRNVCGDGFVYGGVEACDDGNAIDIDPCIACHNATCGDGLKCSDRKCRTGPGGGPELCDDGNLVDGDGCSHECRVESCGNGRLDAGEECDDRNDVSGDGCDGNCTRTRCGNAIITAGEECDDGPGNDDATPDACRTDCRLPRCGDRVVDATEGCDDGNADEADGCRSNCEESCRLTGVWTTAGTGGPTFIDPVGLDLHRGWLFVADGGRNRVVAYHPRSNNYYDWFWGYGYSGLSGVSAGGGISAGNELYAAYNPGGGSGGVQRFTVSCNDSSELCPSPRTPFVYGGSYPGEIAADPSGAVYVTDIGTGVLKYAAPTGWRTLIPRPTNNFIRSLAVGSDQNSLWIGYAANSAGIEPYSLSGTLLGSPVGVGYLGTVSGIRVGPSGRIYVADASGSRIVVFDRDHTRRWTIGSPGAAPGQLGPCSSPGICDLRLAVCEGAPCEGSGEVYVSDRANKRIQRFTCPVVGP